MLFGIPISAIAAFVVALAAVIAIIALAVVWMACYICLAAMWLTEKLRDKLDMEEL